MDTGDANHLDLTINKITVATCPRSHPFAVSSKDTAPFYGRYCCKTDDKRVNAYVQHDTIADVCSDYIDCPSHFDDHYATDATNGFYCKDATLFDSNLMVKVVNDNVVECNNMVPYEKARVCDDIFEWKNMTISTSVQEVFTIEVTQTRPAHLL